MYGLRTSTKSESATDSSDHSKKNRNQILIAGVALSLIAGGALYYYFKKKRPLPNDDNDLFDESYKNDAAKIEGANKKSTSP